MVTIPQIGVNGTSKEQLISETEAAVNAVRVALSSVESMTVHGRDFDPESFKKAQSEHNYRIQRLRNVLEELSELWEGLEDQ